MKRISIYIHSELENSQRKQTNIISEKKSNLATELTVRFCSIKPSNPLTEHALVDAIRVQSFKHEIHNSQGISKL